MISRSKLATSSRLVTSAWFGKEKFKIFFKIATISAIVFILTTKFCLNQVVLNFDSYDQSGVFMEGDEDIENIDLTAVENKKCHRFSFHSSKSSNNYDHKTKIFLRKITYDFHQRSSTFKSIFCFLR